MTAEPMVTTFVHTPEVERALSVGRLKWPDEGDESVLLHVLQEGASAIRRELVSNVGDFAGLYGPGYLEELRRGWPD